jgi:hypothetical protein
VFPARATVEIRYGKRRGKRIAYSLAPSRALRPHSIKYEHFGILCSCIHDFNTKFDNYELNYPRVLEHPVYKSVKKNLFYWFKGSKKLYEHIIFPIFTSTMAHLVKVIFN